jgi:hypothetical protein
LLFCCCCLLLVFIRADPSSVLALNVTWNP